MSSCRAQAQGRAQKIAAICAEVVESAAPPASRLHTR